MTPISYLQFMIFHFVLFEISLHLKSKIDGQFCIFLLPCNNIDTERTFKKIDERNQDELKT